MAEKSQGKMVMAETSQDRVKEGNGRSSGKIGLWLRQARVRWENR